MDKSNGQIWNNGQIMDKNDLKWILNGLNGNHTLVYCPSPLQLPSGSTL